MENKSIEKNYNSDENLVSESEMMKIRREKFFSLKNSGKNPFDITKFNQSHFAQKIKDDFENLEGKTVSIAGRITSWRKMGKASFMDILDSTRKIQVYLKIDDIGEEKYEDMSYWDIGDIVGIEGTVMRTNMGELSVKANK